MLKAKARASLLEVPQIERILFNQCLAEYKPNQITPVTYAKCLVKLIKAKNRLKEINNDYQKVEEYKERGQKRIRRFRHFFTIWRKRKSNKLIKLRKLKKRNKRSAYYSSKTLFGDKMDYELPRNIRNLRILERYARTLKHCRRFISAMNTRNAKYIGFLSNLVPNVRLSPRLATTPSNLDGLQTQIEQFTDQLTSISERSKNNDNLSLLSPRLFALYPRKKSKTTKNNFNLNSNISQLLSPDIFGFHNQTFSLFPLEAIGQKEQIEWLDLLMNITGMNRILELSQIETKLLPAIKQIEAKEKEWDKLKASLDNKQLEMINKLGYTYLNVWQQKIIKMRENERTEKSWNTVENAESVLEAKIEAIAKENIPSFRQLNNEIRKKRQVGGLAPDTEIGVHPIPRILTLEPFAFDTRLGGVILEGLFLSPHAFYREIISPEILTIRLLSPVAFYATILSPMAVFARVLSPEVFKAQILTPQFLDTYTLSPEAFMAEVLSPIAAEARVASPRALFVQILGPSKRFRKFIKNIFPLKAAGEVSFLSPNFFAILVLSPHFLSPRIYSKEHYLIEILSPHILGGEHSSESEEDEHEHLGGAVRFVGWPDHSHGGKKKKGEGESENKGKEEEGGREQEGGHEQGGEEGHQHTEGEHTEGTGQHSEGAGQSESGVQQAGAGQQHVGGSETGQNGAGHGALHTGKNTISH
uniref:Uncharacterized protein n=1 Tax=Meloidogyne hapla TaxID=6305 RepID=A0A1I8BSQ4_MELHA